jgi:D-methionine transport system ATP-binding protein
LSKKEIREKVRELLQFVDISEKENAYPSQLSGGQKQRVAIARALANDPKILLCDEATSALDPQTTKSILQLLKRLNEKLGITVIIITHEMTVVKEICSRVAVMDRGRIVEEGEVFTIFTNPQQQITREFIKTTSNLQKIDALIKANSQVVTLNPGEIIVRLSYVQRNASEPLISTVSQKFDVHLNIIFADIEIVQGAPIGGTVAIISGERDKITKAIEYLIEKHVGVEVIKDAGTIE